MRRYLAFLAVGIAALGVAWAAGGMDLGQTVAEAMDGAVSPPGLERKFTGGWLLDAYLGETPVQVVTALQAGGSLVANCTTRNDGRFNATTIGSWRPTSPRTMAATELIFIQDYEGNLFLYEKVNFEMTLSDDGNSMEGASLILLYWPDQDPLDPEEEPFVEIPVPVVTGRRIVVE